jgi:HEAT repeat protein
VDAITRTQLDNIYSTNRELQNKAFSFLLEGTEEPVDWAYEAWDELVKGLSDKDNHVRAIASQILANLAKSSDPEKRILKDFEALIAVTKDERFVTARHCMQSIWKVGAAGQVQQKILVDGLEQRFNECTNEKNCTLIRYDIIQGLRNLYDAVKDERIKTKALELIQTEQDLKYRKKYAGVWRSK